MFRRLALAALLLAASEARAQEAAPALAEAPRLSAPSCTSSDISRLRPEVFCDTWDHLRGEPVAEKARKACTEFYQASVNTLREICTHQHELETVVAQHFSGDPSGGGSGQRASFDETALIARGLVAQYQSGKLRIQNTEARLRHAYDAYANVVKDTTKRGVAVMDAESQPTRCGVTGSKPSLLFLGVSSGSMAHAGQAYSNVQSIARVYIANATHNARVLASLARAVRGSATGLTAPPQISPADAADTLKVNQDNDVVNAVSGSLAAFARGLQGGVSMETITRTAERILEYGVVQAERSRLVQDLVRGAGVTPDFAEKVLGTSQKALASAIALGFLGMEVAHRMLDHGRLDLLDYVFLGAKLVIYMGFASGSLGTGVGAVVASVGLEGMLELLEHSIRTLLDQDREERLRTYLSVMGPQMRQLKDLPQTSPGLSQKFACEAKEVLRMRPQALPTISVTVRYALDNRVRDAYAACCAGNVR